MLVLGTGGQCRAPKGSCHEHLSTAYNQTQQIKGHVCVVETGAALLCPTRQTAELQSGDQTVIFGGVYPEVLVLHMPVVAACLRSSKRVIASLPEFLRPRDSSWMRGEVDGQVFLCIETRNFSFSFTLPPSPVLPLSHGGRIM